MPITRIITAIRTDLHPTSERGRLMRSAGAAAALKVGSLAIAFAASLVYARALGPHGYGLYAYVIAWASLLTVPAGLGVPQYALREGAKTPAGARRLCAWADRWLLISGAAAGALLACAVFIPQAAGARWLFVVAAPLPLLNNLSGVRQALVQARGRVARSQWPNLVLAPAAMLAALIGLWLWQGALYPIELAAAMTGAAVLPLLVNQFQLGRVAPGDGDPRQAQARIRATLPFMWLGLLHLVNSRTDLVMLGALNGGYDAGVYAVANRAAGLVPFFLVAANSVVAPRAARLYHAGDQQQLQRLVTASIRRVGFLTIPLALVMIVSAEPLLAFLFGPAYADGADALAILAGAQLVNVCAGPSGMLLNMTGHEKHTAIGVGIGAASNVVLNAVLIPLYGSAGAAIATGASVVTWNAVLWYWTYRRIGIQPAFPGR